MMIYVRCSNLTQEPPLIQILNSWGTSLIGSTVFSHLTILKFSTKLYKRVFTSNKANLEPETKLIFHEFKINLFLPAI